MSEKRYVQYGCGHSAPEQWINFDVSPTLRIQKVPVVGTVLKKYLNTTFPPNVRYGDIVKGLPVQDNFCDGVYCSHVLEHLSLSDFRMALRNTYKILKPGGVFRCVVPDLEHYVRKYIQGLNEGDENASIVFLEHDSLLGLKDRARGLRGIATSIYGNSHHLWMWDSKSFTKELRDAGFRNIRNCSFNDADDQMFRFVENSSRFNDAVAIECRK